MNRKRETSSFLFPMVALIEVMKGLSTTTNGPIHMATVLCVCVCVCACVCARACVYLVLILPSPSISASC